MSDRISDIEHYIDMKMGITPLDSLRKDMDIMYNMLEGQGRYDELSRLKELAEPAFEQLNGFKNHCIQQIVAGQSNPMDQKFKDRLKENIWKLSMYMKEIRL